MASMAYDSAADKDLIALSADHLFEPSITKIGFRRGTFLRGFMYEFIELFAPHLTHELMQSALELTVREDIDRLFRDIELPLR